MPHRKSPLALLTTPRRSLSLARVDRSVYFNFHLRSIFSITIDIRPRVTPRRIKQLRKHLNLTQQGLADLLGVPQPTVGRWEAAMSSPRGLYLKALMELAEKAKKRVGRKQR